MTHACSFAYKVVCVDDRFTSHLLFTREKMQSTKSLKKFLKKMIIAKN